MIDNKKGLKVIFRSRLFCTGLLLILSLFFFSCQDNTTDPDSTDPVIEPTPYDTLESSEWHYLGLDGIRISDLKVDSFDRNIIFAGMASNFSAGQTGKLFRSMDGGFSWDTMLVDINVTYIDISQSSPGKIIVTGSKNALNPMHLLKTEDYGESWSDIPIPHLGLEEGIARCRMSPRNDQRLFIQVLFPIDGKFFRSDDEGVTWQQKYYLDWYYLAAFEYDFNPFVDDEILLLIRRSPYILISNDNGDSFLPIESPVFSPYPNIRYNPFKENQIAIQDNWNGVFLSEDKGMTWKSLDIAVNDTSHTLDIEFLENGIITDVRVGDYREILLYDFDGNFVESLGYLIRDFYEMHIECYSNVILIGSNGVYVRRI